MKLNYEQVLELSHLYNIIRIYRNIYTLSLCLIIAITMEEESNIYLEQSNPDPCCICNCLCDDNEKTSTDNLEISDRKLFILTTVARTESYLREHRIPELLRVLLTMILAHLPDKPVAFLEKLLDDYMLYRAGYGLPPVLFETRYIFINFFFFLVYIYYKLFSHIILTLYAELKSNNFPLEFIPSIITVK